MKVRTGRIHALTSMRFFAALYVVLYHTLDLAYGNEIAGSWVEKINSLGYISVSFFFLLSGYILALVYLPNASTVVKRNFYAARFARIYPLFLITFCADLPYAIAQRASQYGWHKACLKTMITGGAHLIMLQAWIPGIHGINQPNWSLSVETFFYGIFPLIGLPLWRLKGTTIWIAAVCVWIVSQAAVWMISPHLSVTTAKFNPLVHIGTFVLGILLARLQHSSGPLAQVRADSNGVVAGIVLLILGVIATVVFWRDVIPLPNLNAGLLSPIFALLIWVCSTSRSWMLQWLNMSWLVLLGEASFGLYLIHSPINHFFEVQHWDHSKALYPVYLLVCIGLSVASFYCIENPSRKWLLGRLDLRSRETKEEASDAQ